MVADGHPDASINLPTLNEWTRCRRVLECVLCRKGAQAFATGIACESEDSRGSQEAPKKKIQWWCGLYPDCRGDGKLWLTLCKRCALRYKRARLETQAEVEVIDF